MGFFFYRYNITRHHYSFFFCFVCRNSVFNRHLNLGLFFLIVAFHPYLASFCPMGHFRKPFEIQRNGWLTELFVNKRERTGEGKNTKVRHIIVFKFLGAYVWLTH